MRRCSFRPRSFYEAEVGCPLDHCGWCGQHVTTGEDHWALTPCPELALATEHYRREAAAPLNCSCVQDGVECPDEPFACGQRGCPVCDGPEADPMGSPADYE